MKFFKHIKQLFGLEKKSQDGFSIMELIIALAIFLIVSASIYGLLNMGRVSRNRSSRRTDVLKNARAALHLIGRDALNAGLGYHKAGAIVPDDFLSNNLGLPQDADSDRDILTAVIAGNNLFQNDLQDNPTDRTDIIAFAYRDLDFNSGEAMDLKDTYQGGNPTTTRIELNKSETTNIKPFDLCLIEAGSTQVGVMVSRIEDLKKFDLEPGDPLGINLPYDGTGTGGTLLKKCNPPTIEEHCVTNVTSLKRFFWVSYKVKQDGTLVRILYGNNTGKPSGEQIREQPLAYNIKDLQFKYLLENGVVTDNPIAGPDGVAGTSDDRPTDFNLIRQVSVKITVQSTELDEQTKKPETIVLDATFSVRNLQYDAG